MLNRMLQSMEKLTTVRLAGHLLGTPGLPGDAHIKPDRTLTDTTFRSRIGQRKEFRETL